MWPSIYIARLFKTLDFYQPVVDVVLAPVLLVDRAVAVAVHEAVHAQQLGLVRGHQAARPAPHHHTAPVCRMVLLLLHRTPLIQTCK